jgi:hypothetical protein
LFSFTKFKVYLFFLCRLTTRISKKKKLKISIHRPTGTRVVFDEEGNAVAPLAMVADTKSGNESFLIDQGIWFILELQ